MPQLEDIVVNNQHAAEEIPPNNDYQRDKTEVSQSTESNNNVRFEATNKFDKHWGDQDFILLLASTYVEEASNGRNGCFVPEPDQLRSYRLYNHPLLRAGLFIVIWVNMMLVLFEEPAVKNLALPYWATMLVELICLSVYSTRLYHSWKFMPVKRHWRDKKILIVFVCILLTLLDMGIYIVLERVDLTLYTIRWSRVLRPVFMINFSESRQVRRTVRNIRRTLPEISNVLVLFFLVIALFSLLGLKLFQNRKYKDLQGRDYFSNYVNIYFGLYVLTTTANNPDLMIPAYNQNNWYALYFDIFTIITMYIFVNIFLAVVYQNYRKHLKNEVKTSVYRKRRNMKSAFDLLKVKRHNKWVVTFSKWKQLVHSINPLMDPAKAILYWRVLDAQQEHAIGFNCFSQFCDLLRVKMDKISNKGHVFVRLLPSLYFSKLGTFIQDCVKHRFFLYFFDLVIIVNAVCIGLNEEKSEVVFLVLFNLEIFMKLFSLGPYRYFRKLWNVFDTLVISAATILYVIENASEKVHYSDFILDFLLILRVLRLFKIIAYVKRFKVIIKTIMQIGPAIITYGGIIFVLYYVFAILGMEFFHHEVHDYHDVALEDRSTVSELTLDFVCGNPRLNGSEFARLRYCEKNFNDVLKSFNVLFDLMVVNQWHVIADGFSRVTSDYARIYFFFFHLLCVIVVLNIFVAFILEAFMLQFSFSQGNFEVALGKKIAEKGRASSSHMSYSNGPNSPPEDFPPLDTDFEIQNYLNKREMTFKLRKTHWKNAEVLLQQMFEDELDEKDLGPGELESDADDLLEELVEQQPLPNPRKMTLHNIGMI